MKKKNTSYLISLATFLLLSIAMNAQVTIGSSTAPVPGSLLDLKEYNDNKAKEGGRNAEKGLGLPRLKLTVLDKLTDIEGPDGTDDAEYTGLIVYNVSGNPIPKCAPIPDGLYVWNGRKWLGLGVKKEASASIDLGPQDYFDLPSGLDARKIKIPKIKIDLQWDPSDKPLSYTIDNTLNGGVKFTTSPLATSPINTTPSTFEMSPDIITSDIYYYKSPWISRESDLTFKVLSECGDNDTKKITINQTNYALMVNDTIGNSIITCKTGVINNFDVKGNTEWTTAKNDPSNMLSATITGATLGSTHKDGSHHTNIFNYSVTNASKYSIADIIFSDTKSPKRFEDITVGFINCQAGEISLAQWAAKLGTTQDQIHPTTKAAWHKDQDGNIFFSGDFGNAGRWMTTNLAATSFATGARTGVDNTVITKFGIIPNTNTPVTDSEIVVPSAHGSAKSYINPLWAYPSNSPKPAPNQAEMDPTNPTNLIDNPRIGLLYNWSAATNSKGGTTNGHGNNVEEGSDASQNKIQGICPNGWHLPSDYEWTELENEIIQHTNEYSRLADIDPTNPNNIPLGNDNTNTQWRGTLHGVAVKDICEPFANYRRRAQGQSKNILEGGMNLQLVGKGEYDKTDKYGNETYYWTSSSRFAMHAWYRRISYETENIFRDRTLRISLFSVRCKQD